MRAEFTYPLSHRSAATRLAVAFVGWSAIWVIASDYIANAFVPQVSFWRIQTEKGLVYVVVSGLLLWLSVHAMERDEARRRALNESKLKRLKESGLIGVAGRSAEGKIVYTNETLAQMLGYSYHELIGMEMSKLVPSIYDHLREKVQKQLQQFGRTSLFEVELLRKDGFRVPILGGRAILADENGEEIIYFIDITELKRSEEERRQLQEDLQHADKINALGRLAGGVAHDFNNELSIIIGYASLLHARLSGDEASSVNTSQILKAAERARALIRQLLAFSRKQTVRKEVVDLNQVMAEMHSMLRPLLNESVELRVLLSREDECVEIDRSQFQQIMMNLVVNARDAMPDGGVLTIAVGASSMNGNLTDREINSREFVALRIMDTGTGIDESIRLRIFEPFFTTKERTGGTGLGLAMVYGIVKQNNGDITVTSKPGQGTSFTLKFPRAERSSASPPQTVRAEPGSLRATVLLVEDLMDLREMLAQILSRKGLRVLVASDGVNAIKIASETQGTIDLIITDVMMPRMRGPDAVRKIRESRPAVKAIYLSGYTESLVPEGNDVLIPKPVAPEALLNAIEKCLFARTGPPENVPSHSNFAA